MEQKLLSTMPIALLLEQCNDELAGTSNESIMCAIERLTVIGRKTAIIAFNRGVDYAAIGAAVGMPEEHGERMVHWGVKELTKILQRTTHAGGHDAV